MTMYRVARTETINYTRDFTREELIENGMDPDILPTDPNLIDVKAINEAIDDDDDLRDNLTEATERHGDVQGSVWSVRQIVED